MDYSLSHTRVGLNQMVSNNHNTPTVLRIWQQNLNTSFSAQHSLLNSIRPNDYDVITIQEPHINSFNNTISNCHYHVLYPTMHFIKPSPKTRAVTLISMEIDPNAWQQIPFPSLDVVVLQFTRPFGKCVVFNIYVQRLQTQHHNGEYREVVTIHLFLYFLH